MDKPNIIKDGYIVIEPQQATKGIQCGLCGIKFDNDKAYGYVCSQPNCPMFMQVTC